MSEHLPTFSRIVRVTLETLEQQRFLAAPKAYSTDKNLRNTDHGKGDLKSKKKKICKYPTEIENAMACIYYLLEDSEECQLSLNELMEQIDGIYLAPSNFI
ncbi:hypothetical protein AVEN_18330-1 [Araneus ventricosus]|uniref:Uncharacterized protein n=1 Tax=Araneus ventricosus TaxID=182803 RepID=A0A4Y2EMX5_ARAVE|nr:hypothetical protein AVEN_18330-1 [Araneus ventricosus]